MFSSLGCVAALATLGNADYLSNDEVYERMLDASQEYPDFTHLYSIGTSINGELLLFIDVMVEQCLLVLTAIVHAISDVTD